MITCGTCSVLVSMWACPPTVRGAINSSCASSMKGSIRQSGRQGGRHSSARESQAKSDLISRLCIMTLARVVRTRPQRELTPDPDPVQGCQRCASTRVPGRRSRTLPAIIPQNYHSLTHQRCNTLHNEYPEVPVKFLEQTLRSEGGSLFKAFLLIDAAERSYSSADRLTRPYRRVRRRDPKPLDHLLQASEGEVRDAMDRIQKELSAAKKSVKKAASKFFKHTSCYSPSLLPHHSASRNL